MNSKISVVVLTSNSQEQISKTILSVKSLTSEIIALDDNSTDETLKILRKFNVKVFTKRLSSFSIQRNFGLKKAKGDWILFLDSDEVLSKKLAREINEAVKDKSKNGYFIRRIDEFLGKKIKYGEAGNIKLLRLARKGKGLWVRAVHEQWKIKGEIGTLSSPIFHYPHKSVEDFFDQINKFSSLHAASNHQEKKISNVFKIIFWPLGKFIYYFVFKMGIMDGVRGLIYAVMMSIHSFLSWIKLWEIQKQKPQKH